MKKLILALVALFTVTIQASAMSYEQAREQALFLTDKMAYELNLTDEQYEAAYEVNLDYLMGINSYDDLYGNYWNQRNLDLSYILLDWQYRSYLQASYFYRPLYWNNGYWHFSVYSRYPHRDYYYFGRPTFYMSYRGDHSWYRNGGRSWYNGRNYVQHSNRNNYAGMRDGFARGDYGRGSNYASQSNRSFGNGTRFNTQQNNRTRAFGSGNTQSRTRSFGNDDSQSRTRSFGNDATQGRTRSFGNDYSQNSTRSMDNDNMQSRSRSFGNRSLPQSSTRATVTQPNSSRSFGNSGMPSSPSRTFTPNSSSRSQSFGSSQSAPSRSFSPSTRSSSSMSRGTSQSAPSRSFGGGNSGGSRSSGGHFGNRR